MTLATTTRIRQAATVAMDTVVSVQVVTDHNDAVVEPALHRALGWFATVEHACSRFDPTSELRQLLEQPRTAVEVSAVLFEAVRFALILARATGGRFDPTIGGTLESHGFNRNYVTGQTITSDGIDASATYRDVRLGPGRTITLRRPLVLDLGAVAKGLAIDLASCELARVCLADYCIEAGGDLFASGLNPEGQLWRVGIQSPRDPHALATTLEVYDLAVCTSGDYERKSANGAGHHILDPRTGQSTTGIASLTVIAPTAMAADGLSTAAFVLGLDQGPRLLEQSGVGGVFITPSGEIYRTTTKG